MQCLYLTWGEISAVMSDELTKVLSRRIEADAAREYLQCWVLQLFMNPLTPDELEKVFDYAGADEWDREQNYYEDGKVMELCEALCGKIINKHLPFKLADKCQDEKGVWFISYVGAIDRIQIPIPGGVSLSAELFFDTEYPGINVFLRKPGEIDKELCFAEHNPSKPLGKEVCIGAYAENMDEPAYYESYNDPQQESPNN